MGRSNILLFLTPKLNVIKASNLVCGLCSPKFKKLGFEVMTLSLNYHDRTFKKWRNFCCVIFDMSFLQFLELTYKLLKSTLLFHKNVL